MPAFGKPRHWGSQYPPSIDYQVALGMPAYERIGYTTTVSDWLLPGNLIKLRVFAVGCDAIGVKNRRFVLSTLDTSKCV
jgi:hypothetical protein